MANKKTTSIKTSITIEQIGKHLRDKPLRATMTCDFIPGLTFIKMHKGGGWRWRYMALNGKRRVATVGSYPAMKPQQAAEKVLHWMENEIDPLARKETRRQTAIDDERKAEQRTLRHYLETYYIPYMDRSWKLKNVKANEGRIRGHFSFLLDRDMSTITRADIDEWQREQEGKGRAYTTIQRTYGSLKTLLRRAVTDGVLDSDPLANHKLLEPTRKDQKAKLSDPNKAERRMLTANEIKGIHTGLDAFAEEIRAQRRSSRAHGKPHLPDLDKVTYPHWFIPYCHLALHTGLRPGDLTTLTWQELNIPFGRLTKICEKTSHALRRDRKPAVVDMKLNPTIKQIMTGWHNDQDKPDDGPVFPSPRTAGVMDSQAYRKPWNRVKELGGIDSNLNFYAFRHHFISAMLAAGVPIFTVAKLAGHKSVEMIQQHYGHLCPDQAAIALDVVAQTVTTGKKKGSKRA